MKRAFTLLELLVICAILATMVAIGVGSIRSGQGSARVKGATRDIYAAIRHARSVALVTGQRVVVTYSNETEDDEPVAKVDVVSAKIMNTSENDTVVQPYYVMDYKDLPQKKEAQPEKRELVHIREAEAKGFASDGKEGGSSAPDGSSGETLEEVLFAPMDTSVVKGMRLKAVKGEESLADETDVQRSHRISMSSNVDWLLKLYKGAKSESETEKNGETASSSTQGKDAKGGTSAADDMQEPVSVVWETNGAVEPHKVWIYADGKKPEDGLLLDIDRFGAVKVLSGDGREEE